MGKGSEESRGNIKSNCKIGAAAYNKVLLGTNLLCASVCPRARRYAPIGFQLPDKNRNFFGNISNE